MSSSQVSRGEMCRRLYGVYPCSREAISCTGHLSAVNAAYAMQAPRLDLMHKRTRQNVMLFTAAGYIQQAIRSNTLRRASLLPSPRDRVRYVAPMQVHAACATSRRWHSWRSADWWVLYLPLSRLLHAL